MRILYINCEFICSIFVLCLFKKFIPPAINKTFSLRKFRNPIHLTYSYSCHLYWHSYPTWTLFQVQEAFPEYFAELIILYKFVHVFFTMAHVWNLYVYMVKIRSFRSELLRALPFTCCGVLTRLAGTTTAAVSIHESVASRSSRKTEKYSMSERE